MIWDAISRPTWKLLRVSLGKTVHDPSKMGGLSQLNHLSRSVPAHHHPHENADTSISSDRPPRSFRSLGAEVSGQPAPKAAVIYLDLYL